MDIKPLSYQTLEPAIALVDKIFPYQQNTMYENARIAFHASLEKANPSYISFLEQMQITEANYWVVLDQNSDKVIGTTGLYTYAEDEAEAYWLGYTCVDPDFRAQGIGAKLVDFAIEKAREVGKKFLRLYTSNFPDQAVAQIIYEKRGLLIIGEEPIEGTNFKKLYRELKL